MVPPYTEAGALRGYYNTPALDGSRPELPRWTLPTLVHHESAPGHHFQLAQASSYKVGQTLWLKIRADAREWLGAKFDIRTFHDAGLTAAPMPMSVLERVMGEWVRSQPG